MKRLFVNLKQLVIDGDLRQFEACRSSRSIATTAKLKQSERNSWEWGLRCRMNHAQHELRVCAASGPCCGRQPGPLRGKKIALTAGRYSFQTVQWVVVGKSQNPKNPKIPKFKNLKINVRGGCDCTGKQVWRRLACKGPRLVDWVGCGRSAVSLLGRRALHQSSALRLRGLLAASLTRVLNSSWFPLSPPTVSILTWRQMTVSASTSKQITRSQTIPFRCNGLKPFKPFAIRNQIHSCSHTVSSQPKDLSCRLSVSPFCR